MIDATHPQKPDGPRGLGLLKLLAGYYRNPLDTLASLPDQYGNIVLLQVSSYTVYQIAQPEHIKHVLQDNNRNYRMAGAFDQTRPVVGRGLSINEGDSWLFHRRLMQPLFGRGQVAIFASMIVQATSAMLERWRAVLSATPLEQWRTSAAGNSLLISIYPELLALNHHILGKMLFNIDVTGTDRRVLDALSFVRTYTNQRINALVTVPTRWPTPRNRRFWESVALLDDFAYKRIRDARANNRQTDDLLSMMLNIRDEKTGVGFNDEELHDELMTMFFAAYEDPANALSWALSLLTHYPEVEKRLRDEVETVLNGRAPTYEDLSALVYTGAVVDETLRLYPPTWSILRDAAGDDVIGNYAVKSGSSVLVNIYLTHRLSEFWDHPDAFNPDRFLPENSAGRPRYAYLPFGGGPRQCIGAALAVMQLKLILVMLIQACRYEWASAYPPRPDASHSLRPPRDVAVRLRQVT